MVHDEYEEAKKQAKKYFQLLLPILENVVGRPTFTDINEEYNISCFHIDQWQLSDAKNFHKEVMEKYMTVLGKVSKSEPKTHLVLK